MSWRDVPMPAQIARLERDARGYPIPYVAMRYPLLVPPPIDVTLGMTAVEDTSQPAEPVLGFMSEVRQRRCWLHEICQVCERSLERRPRYLAGGLHDDPLESFGFREPYVCGSCMMYAVQVCPGLVTGHHGGGLRVVRARSVEFAVERLCGYAPDGSGDIRRFPMGDVPGTVAFYILGVVTDGDVVTVDEFLGRSPTKGLSSAAGHAKIKT